MKLFHKEYIKNCLTSSKLLPHRPLLPLKFVKKNVDCGTTCKKEGTICTNSSNERGDESKEARLELMLQNTHTHTHTHTKCITLLVGTPTPSYEWPRATLT